MSLADAHLLIVDDDERIRGLLQKFLMRSGFLVTTARDAAHARRILSGLEFDMIVLDVMMPGEDGMSLCRDLRQKITTPIMLLTAKGGTDDRITGLEAGADDYLAKPANPRELLARIRAVLRRSNVHSKVPVLEVEDLVLNQASREVRLDGELKELTSTEFSILLELLQHRGEVVSKRDLYLSALGREPVAHDRSLDMHVSNLRRKLGPDPRGDNRIETIRGIGYQFRVS